MLEAKWQEFIHWATSMWGVLSVWVMYPSYISNANVLLMWLCDCFPGENEMFHFFFSRLKFQRLYLSNATLHGSEIELCSRCRSVTNSGTLGNVTLEEFWSQKVTPQNSGLYPAQRFSAIISIHLAYVISYSNVFTQSLKLFVTVLGLNCLLTGMRRGGFIISNTH